MKLIPIVGLVALLAVTVRPAHAQQQLRGSLTYVCTPDAVPTGIDSVVDCTFTALNEGETAITRPRLNFAPSGAVSPPDRYYFFSYDLDGVAKEPGYPAASLTFDFNPIAPGEASKMHLRVIVRATREFGADVQLLGGEYEPVLDRGTLALDVGASEPEVTLLVDHQFSMTEIARRDQGQEYGYGLTLDNPASDTKADVEVSAGYRYGMAEGGGPGWTKVQVESGLWGHYRAELDAFNGRTGYGFILASNAGACYTPALAVIATVHLEPRTVIVATLVDTPLICGTGGEPLTVSEGPSAGVGYDSPPSSAAPEAGLFSVIGLALVVIGTLVRRRSEGTRHHERSSH